MRVFFKFMLLFLQMILTKDHNEEKGEKEIVDNKIERKTKNNVTEEEYHQAKKNLVKFFGATESNKKKVISEKRTMNIPKPINRKHK